MQISRPPDSEEPRLRNSRAFDRGSISFRVKRLFSFDTALAARVASSAVHVAQLAVMRITSPSADGRGAAPFSGASGAARTSPSPDEDSTEGHWPNELVRCAGREGWTGLSRQQQKSMWDCDRAEAGPKLLRTSG